MPVRNDLVGYQHNGRVYRGGEWNDVNNWAPISARQQMLDAYTAEPPAPSSGGLGDYAAQFAGGALGATQSMTNVFGADNAVSRGIGAMRDTVSGWESDELKAARQREAQLMDEAKADGYMAEIGQAAQNFFSRPGGHIVEGFGSVVPYLASLLTPAGWARLAASGAMGTAQGIGEVKGNQYQRVYDALVASNVDPVEAETLALEAQAYDGPNVADQLVGGGLGLFAGVSGVQRMLPGMGRAAGEQAAGYAGHGLTRRTMQGMAEESVPEFAQGFQAEYAGGRAMQNAGFDVDPMSGAFGAGTVEALSAAPIGGAFGAMQRDRPVDLLKDPDQDTQPAPSVDISGNIFDSTAATADIVNQNVGIGQRSGVTKADFSSAWNAPLPAPMWVVDFDGNPKLLKTQGELYEHENFGPVDNRVQLEEGVARTYEGTTRLGHANDELIDFADQEYADLMERRRYVPTVSTYDATAGLTPFVGGDIHAEAVNVPISGYEQMDVAGNPQQQTGLVGRQPVTGSQNLRDRSFTSQLGGYSGATDVRPGNIEAGIEVLLSTQTQRQDQTSAVPANLTGATTTAPKRPSATAEAQTAIDNALASGRVDEDTHAEWTNALQQNPYNRKVAGDVLAFVQSLEQSTLPTTAPIVEGGLPAIIESAKLSASEAKVAKVMADLVANNEDLNGYTDAKLAELAGFTGPNAHREVAQYKKRVQAKLTKAASAMGVDLNTLLVPRAIEYEDTLGLSPSAQPSVLEMGINATDDADGVNLGMGVVNTARGSQITQEEDRAATALAAARPDPVADARMTEAKARRKQRLFNHPEAAAAIEDFEDYTFVPVEALSENDAMDMMASYDEFKETGNEAQLLADWDDIAQRYDQSLGGDRGDQRRLPEGVPERAGQSASGAADRTSQTNDIATGVQQQGEVAGPGGSESQAAEGVKRSVVDDVVDSWKQTIRAFREGRLPRTESPVLFDSMPAVLQKLGLPDVPILVRMKHVVEDSGFNHGVTDAQLERLPLEMVDPALVTVNLGADGKYSLNFVTSMSTDGGVLTVALQPGVYGVSSGPVHMVATITPRAKQALAGRVLAGDVVYIGDKYVLPASVQSALGAAQKKYGQTAVDLKALIASKFSKVARTGKIAYRSQVVKLIESGQAKYSTGERAQGQAAATLRAKLLKVFRSPYFFDRAVDVVNNESELPPKLSRDIRSSKGVTQGFYDPGTKKVYLLANNIREGAELSVLLHEVGVHMGMKNLLGTANYNRLITQLQTWTLDGTGTEGRLARRALERVRAAEAKLGKQLSQEDFNEELLAYFVEEAVNAGINPTAVGKGKLYDWFRTLWAAVKAAVRKLGMNPESLTARNVVDLAYGAARMELNAAWHGTAADFRKFNHGFMGSGEGAQAFGWGTYLAQRVGIAKGYWKADVERKDVSTPEQTLQRSRLEDELRELEGFNIAPDKESYSVPTYKGAPLKTGEELFDAEGVVGDAYFWMKLPFDEAIRTAKNILKDTLSYGLDAAEEKQVVESLSRLDTLKESDFSLKLDEAGYAEAMRNYKTYERRIAEIKKELGKHQRPEGSLMRVDTAIQDDELLDWDKPLSEQSETIRAGVHKALRDAGLADGHEKVPRLTVPVRRTTPDGRTAEGAGARVDYQTGKQVYQLLEAKLGSDKAASEYLDSIGIKGIKFLDAISRTDDPPTLADLGFPDLAVSGKDIDFGYLHISPDLTNVKVNTHGELMLRAIIDRKVDAYGRTTPARQEWVFADNVKWYGDVDAAALLEAARGFTPIKTRNIVVFNDKNIHRVFSEVGADPESRKFSFAAVATPAIEQGRKWQADMGGKLTALSPKLLTNFQLWDQFKHMMPSLETHMTLLDRMTMRQQQIMNKTHDVLNTWSRLKKPTIQALNQVMHDATLWGMHPDEAFDSAGNNHLGKNDRAKYDKLKSRYAALPTDAKQAYQKAKAILAENWELRKKIYADVVNSTDLSPEAKVKEIKRHEAAIKELKGPYFPLMRFGDYLVVGESAELADLRSRAETATGTEATELRKKIASMEKSPKHYQSWAFESKSERDAKQAELTAAGMNAMPMIGSDFSKMTQTLPFSASEAVNAAIGKQFPTETAGQLREIISKLALSATPEHSALQRQIKRKGVAGASTDMMRAFVEAVEADSFHLSRMEASKELSANLFGMKSEARKSQQDVAMRVYSNIVQRLEMDYTNKRQPFLQNMTRLSSIWHLGVAPSYLLTNMTQPFMITSGHLAGKFGMRRSMGALSSAWVDSYNLLKTRKGNKILDRALADVKFDEVFKGDELALMQYLYDLGKLDIVNNIDTGMLTKGVSPKLVTAARMFNWAQQNIELVNRVTTALATYRLEISRGATPEDARAKAREAIELTQLSYDDTNAAYFMKAGHFGGLNRFPMQFKKYQQGMLYLLFKTFPAKGASADEKKSFAYLMGMQLLFAGARGLPIMFPVTLASALLGDADDEDGDWETQMRNYVADVIGPDAARVFWKGLPTALGVDWSGLGMGNLLNPMGMLQARDLTNAETGEELTKEIILNAAGAPVGLMSRFVDGLMTIEQGDWDKGLEKLMPKFIASPMKGARYAEEGITTRAGNEAVAADTLDAWDIALKSMGFQPVVESEYYTAKQVTEDRKAAIQDRRNRLIAKAARGENVQAEIQVFNKEHPNDKINRSSILRSKAQRKRREATEDDELTRFAE